MSTPQKSLFSLLSLCLKFLQSVEIWQSSDKKKFAQFFETRCSIVSSIFTRFRDIAVFFLLQHATFPHPPLCLPKFPHVPMTVGG